MNGGTLAQSFFLLYKIVEALSGESIRCGNAKRFHSHCDGFLFSYFEWIVVNVEVEFSVVAVLHL